MSDPEKILERMQKLIEETKPNPSETKPLTDSGDQIARSHREDVRKGPECEGQG